MLWLILLKHIIMPLFSSELSNFFLFPWKTKSNTSSMAIKTFNHLTSFLSLTSVPITLSSSLPVSHRGLRAVSRLHLTHFCLRALAGVYHFSWNALDPETHSILLHIFQIPVWKLPSVSISLAFSLKTEPPPLVSPFLLFYPPWHFLL